MKKNIFSIIIVLSIIFSLFGCSTQPKPEETVQTYLDAFKTGVTIDNGIYFDGSASAFDDLMAEDEGTPSEVTEAMKEIIFGFDFTVKESVISKDKETATVNIEITTVDGANLINNFISQYMMNAFAMAFAGKTQEEIEKYAVDLFASLSSNLAKNRVFPVTVKLVWVEEKWLIAGGEENEALFDAMTGGMLSAAKNFQDLTEESN